MNEAAVVTWVKSTTEDCLERQFGDLNLSTLSSTVEELEAYLVTLCRDAVERYAPMLYGCAKHGQSTYFLGPDGEFCELAIGFDVAEPNVVCISFLVRSPNAPSKVRRKTFPVNGYGKCNKVRAYFPCHLKVDMELLGAIAKSVFEGGYAWLTARIESLAASSEVALVNDLYSYARSVLPSGECQRSLWFACLAHGYGFRLIEHDVAAEAIRLIDRNADAYGCSTHRLVAELLGTRLPSDQLLMRIAANFNRCIDGDMSFAKYKQQGSIYASTLASLYGKESFTIFPILVSDRLSVLALFPTEHREDIEPALVAHASRLRDISLRMGRNIDKAFHCFDRRVKSRFDFGLLNKAIIVQPNVFGVGVNVNGLVDLVQQRRTRS